MTLFLTILYEAVYTIFYFGLLFSKSTILTYVPNPSIVVRFLFLLLLLSGFFLPYYLKLLKITLTLKHYLIVIVCLLGLYSFASWRYYAKEMDPDRLGGFHSFLQIKPTVKEVEIPKPQGMYRILCLGGSTTEGTGAGDYPGLLEEMLKKRYSDKNIEVVNGGHFFYNTQHAIIEYLFFLKDIQPDLIIFFEAINDLMTSFTMPPFASSPYRKDYGHFFGVLGNIRYPRTFNQVLASFFYADLRCPPPKPVSFSDFKSRDSFRRNLETLIAITRCWKIPLILSNQAHCFSQNNDSEPSVTAFPRGFLVDKGHYADEKSWYEGMNLFNTITKVTAETYSVPFVDQAAALEGKKDLFVDAVHLTRTGMEINAQLFFNKIIECGFIP